MTAIRVDVAFSQEFFANLLNLPAGVHTKVMKWAIRFQADPTGGGTEVTVQFEYDPPGGKLGRFFAKLTGDEPQQQVELALQRFKELMETGDIRGEERAVRA